MNIAKANVYFFSGTGNTFLVARKLVEVFTQRGITTNLQRIERTNPAEVDADATIGLVVPVALQGTYHFIWEFVKALPQRKNTPIFLMTTLAQYSGGLVGPMRRILEKKGYNPIGAREFIMPSNYMIKSIDEQKNQTVIQAALTQTEQFAADLLDSKTTWEGPSFLSGIMGMSRQKWVWKLMRRFYKLNVIEDECVKCGLCVRLCPVGNIEMNDYPVFSNRCQMCQRCFAYCPRNAIQTEKKVFAQYKAAELSDMIKK